VSSDRKIGNGRKPKHRTVHLNIRKHLLTVRVTKHRHGFSGELVESPSLKILKNCLDMVLGN